MADCQNAKGKGKSSKGFRSLEENYAWPVVRTLSSLTEVDVGCGKSLPVQSYDCFDKNTKELTPKALGNVRVYEEAGYDEVGSEELGKCKDGTNVGNNKVQNVTSTAVVKYPRSCGNKVRFEEKTLSHIKSEDGKVDWILKQNESMENLKKFDQT